MSQTDSRGTVPVLLYDEITRRPLHTRTDRILLLKLMEKPRLEAFLALRKGEMQTE